VDCGTDRTGESPLREGAGAGAVLLVGAIVAVRGGLEGIFGDITDTLTDPAAAAAAPAAT